MQSYKTDSQQFSWGSAYAWMSKVAGSRSDATSGKGQLLINTSYKKSVQDKNCTLSVKRVLISDNEGETVLLDVSPTYENGAAPVTRQIKAYSTGQLGIWNSLFSFDVEEMPYDVNIDLSLNCPDKQTDHKFSKKLKFKMVQPVIWEQ